MFGKCMARPIALVTGGGRGIGAATSKRLAADGYDILLTYNLSSKPAEMVVDEIRRTGADALAVKVDCNDDGEKMSFCITHSCWPLTKGVREGYSNTIMALPFLQHG